MRWLPRPQSEPWQACEPRRNPRSQVSLGATLARMPGSLQDFLDVPPGDVLIVTDYDGTIAPIVADPARALPMPEVVEHLTALVPLVKAVAVLSGRSESSL